MTDATKPASLFDLFETNSDAENAGIWVPVGPARFKIARAGGANENFKKTAMKRLKPFAASFETLPAKTVDDLAIGIFVDAVLLDWEGVVDRSGALIPYSKEAAKDLLTQLPNLYTVLKAESEKLSNFSQTNLEAAAGN
jgi:hypothetical protein